VHGFFSACGEFQGDSFNLVRAPFRILNPGNFEIPVPQELLVVERPPYGTDDQSPVHGAQQPADSTYLFGDGGSHEVSVVLHDRWFEDQIEAGIQKTDQLRTIVADRHGWNALHHQMMLLFDHLTVFFAVHGSFLTFCGIIFASRLIVRTS
jgi:hypothetical protein